MTKNQCDGCARGLPVEDGLHRGPVAGDLQACTAYQYVECVPGRFSAAQAVVQQIVKMADAALVDLAHAASELEITKEDRAHAHAWIDLQRRPRCVVNWEHTPECDGMARHFAYARVRAGAAAQELRRRYGR